MLGSGLATEGAAYALLTRTLRAAYANYTTRHTILDLGQALEPANS